MQIPLFIVYPERHPVQVDASKLSSVHVLHPSPHAVSSIKKTYIICVNLTTSVVFILLQLITILRVLLTFASVVVE